MSTTCSANPYDNDSNYIFIGRNASCDSGKIYLNLKSVKVQEYNPPHYQIAGEFIEVLSSYVIPGDDTTIHYSTRPFYIVIKYNWDTKESFSKTISYMNERGNIVYKENAEFIKDYYDNPNYAKSVRQRADSLFKAAYNMDFYGY